MSAPRQTLHSSGPTFSRIVAGVMRLNDWDLRGAALADWVEACIDLGITTFDHADIYGGYGNEAIFGEALAVRPALRERMEIVTKCGIMMLTESRPQHRVAHYDTSQAHIVASAEQSLKNLHTDVIDLLLVHRPDPLMDADEIAAAFHQLKSSGKVKHFGVSNFTPHQWNLLQSRLDFKLVTNQVEFSPLHMEPMHDGTFDQAQQHRAAPMIWSPVAGGRVFRPDDDRSGRVHEALKRVGDELGGVPVDQVALAWVMRHPARPLPVMGTGKLERLQSAVAACGIQMDRQQWFSIWEASAGQPVP